MMVPSQHSTDLAATGVDSTQVEAVEPTNPVSPATASNVPKTVEASIKEPPKELSTLPSEQQITSIQKEDVQSKLPKKSTRKALFESDPKTDTTEVIKKLKHDG
ncbi:hypothetical protein Tco_1362201 [Tanacetum coccineum]